MAQTSYSINIPAVSYPGQPVDIMEARDRLSALAVAAALPYGVLAVHDLTNTGDFTQLAAKLPSAAADITVVGSALGFVVADQARAQDPSVSPAQYPQNSAVPLARKGRIWVLSEQAANDGDPVYIRYAATVNGSQLGAVRADADVVSSANHAAALPGAVFRGTTSGAGFAVVEFDLA